MCNKNASTWIEVQMKRRDATVGLLSKGIAGYAMRTGKGNQPSGLTESKMGTETLIVPGGLWALK
jgi:hypothetical protein